MEKLDDLRKREEIEEENTSFYSWGEEEEI